MRFLLTSFAAALLAGSVHAIVVIDLDSLTWGESAIQTGPNPSGGRPGSVSFDLPDDTQDPAVMDLDTNADDTYRQLPFQDLSGTPIYADPSWGYPLVFGAFRAESQDGGKSLASWGLVGGNTRYQINSGDAISRVHTLLVFETSLPVTGFDANSEFDINFERREDIDPIYWVVRDTTGQYYVSQQTIGGGSIDNTMGDIDALVWSDDFAPFNPLTDMDAMNDGDHGFNFDAANATFDIPTANLPTLDAFGILTDKDNFTGPGTRHWVGVNGFTVDAVATRDPGDLQVTKTLITSGPFIQGDELTFDILVFNNSTVPARHIRVEDVLPAGWVFLNGPSSATTGDPNASGQTVAWGINEIPAFGSATLTLTVRADLPGTYDNTATIVSSSIDDTDTSNDSATAAGIVVGNDPTSADLAVSIAGSNAFVTTGIAYELTVENLGPANATDVVASMDFDNGTDGVPGDSSAPVGTLTVNNNDANWDIGSINAGDSVTAIVVVNGPVQNNIGADASVSATNPDFDGLGGSNNDSLGNLVLALPGNFNFDRNGGRDIIDSNDLALFADAYTTNSGDPGYFELADIDLDGDVDLDDFAAWVPNYDNNGGNPGGSGL